MTNVRWCCAVAVCACGCAGPAGVAPPKPVPVEPAPVASQQFVTPQAAPASPMTPAQWCDSLSLENNRFVRETERVMPGCDLRIFVPEDVPSCLTYGEGAWGLRLVRPTEPNQDDTEPCGTRVAALRLQHLQAGGAPIDIDWSGTLNVTHYWGSIRLTTFKLSDLDGDQTPEVYVERHMHEEGYDEVYPELLQLREGGVVPYPVEPYSMAYAADVDKDGRLDILTPWVYRGFRYQTPLADAPMVPENMFVAHAQGNGTFSGEDDVAKSRLLGRCPATTDFVKKACEDGGHASGLLGEAVVCARAWGMTPEAVKRRLAQCCKTYVDYATEDGQCPRQLLEVAAVKPPIRLDR